MSLLVFCLDRIYTIKGILGLCHLRVKDAAGKLFEEQ